MELRRSDEASGSQFQEKATYLREKMQLFQLDQSSSIERLEAQKAANQQKIKDLKNENRETRIRLADAKEITGSGSKVHPHHRAGATDNGGVFKYTDTTQYKEQIRRARKQLDDIRSRCRYQKKIYDSLNDKLKDLDLEAQKPAKDAETYARKLQRALLKYNEAQCIQTTYEQIVKRFKSERMAIHADTISLENSVASKQHDHDEIMRLVSEACISKDAIIAESLKTKAQYEIHKQKRDVELREMQQYVKVCTDFLAHKQKENEDQISLRNGKMPSDEDAQAHINAVAKDLLDQQNRRKVEMHESLLHEIENQIGSCEARHVIEKFGQQRGTLEHLALVDAEKEIIIDALHQQHRALLDRIQELKCLNLQSGGSQSNRPEERLEAKAELPLERAKIRVQRLSSLIDEVRNGVEHIYLTLTGDGLSTTNLSVEEALESIDTLLCKLSDPSVSATSVEDSTVFDESGIEKRSNETMENVFYATRECRKNNDDLWSKKHMQTKESIMEIEGVDARDKNLLRGEELEAELSRRRVKHASNRVLLRSQGRKKSQMIARK